MVIIIDHDEVAKLQMASNTSSFTCNAFLCAPISKEAVGVIVNQVEAWLVEVGSGVSLRNGKTNGISKTLPEGTSGDFDAGSVMEFGVTRCLTVDMLYVHSVK